MKSIAIFAKPKLESISKVGSDLIQWLIDRGCDVYLEEMPGLFIERQPTGFLKDTIPSFIELVIVLGGDGTILRVARALKSYDTPLMSVNLGGLGFLTAFTIDQLYPHLQRILEGRFTVSRRLMLTAQHYRNNRLVHEASVLNDVVINKAALARIIQIETKVADKPLTTYLCDGLIVATPTGSTAYSLSAGGPIICPDMDALILTPICPHTLTNRPIVVGVNQTVELILNTPNSEVSLTLDGQIGYQLHYKDKILVKRAPHEIGIIENPDTTFFQVLSHKLKWGLR